MDRRMARKLVVDEAPNRLFLKYLAEWRDEAKEKGDKSSFTYNKAYKSLKKYPLPLQCGAEAKILENFGDKICKMLDDRLAKDAENDGLTPVELLEKSRKVPASWWDKVNKEAPVAKNKPAKRRKKAEESTQEKKKPKTKTITEMFGVQVKEKELGVSQESSKINNLNNNNEPGGPKIGVTTSPYKSQEFMTSSPVFTLSPGEFDIVLCVDTRETMGESRRKEMGVELNKQNVCYEQRTLHIGDFLWIAQEKPALCVGRKPKELVLNYIIERKILSDLSMSIKDGRFREQKIRLKQSGIGNIIYLIENMGNIENQSLPEQTLRQAIYNTQIVDNICVKFTKNAKATVRYLDLMTKHLQRSYLTFTLEALEISDSQGDFSQPETKKLTPFNVFNEMGSKRKKLTIKEMFIRQLMQIHGMSYDKASAITALYETPNQLVEKYRNLPSEKEKEELISKVKFGLTERNLGIAMSRVVHKVYST
uniref:crossover junction endonuclease MUS81-like n=1 Tax=Styela clava TaxID=7725 RepID=UPI0019392865|nr:crossover junction endonuclease MUS81-like [Styela clava]